MKLQRLLLAAVLPAALFVAACGGGDDSLDDRIDAADPKVRLVHAANGAPAVTLFRNDVAQTDATAVSYRYISPYVDVDTQTDTWSVATAEGDIEIESVDIDAQRGDKYTLLAYMNGLVPEVMLIADPYDKRVGSNDGRVRVVHAAANAGQVDVYIDEPSVALATATPKMTAVAFGTAAPASGSNSVDLEPRSYVLTITAAGTKDVVFTTPFTVADNDDWLLVAMPNGVAQNDIRVLAAPADADRTALELQSQ